MLVQHFLENGAAQCPDKTALVCGNDRLTYAQLDHLATSFAGALVASGIAKQDRVAIFMDNCVEAAVAIFGALKAGAIFSVISPTIKSKKLGFILRDSGAHTLVAHTSKLRVVAEVLSSHDLCLQQIVCSQDPIGPVFQMHLPSNPGGVAVTTWESFLKSDNGPQEHVSLPKTIIDMDLATIVYTSGSTGNPKGVVSAHYNVVSAASAITQYLENDENDIILSVLPLSFDYGLYQLLMAFFIRGTLILERSFAYPYKTIELIVKESVTGFPIVPTIAAVLLQMKDLASLGIGSLRYVTNTAAALPVAHIRRLQSLLPNVKIYSMYGLTECKRVSYLPPQYLAQKPTSVGIPIPNEEVFIVDDKGAQVERGEAGELVVRGSNVMQGYWNAPQETEKKFKPGRYRADAMLYTGDLFKQDEDGFLYFIARKDDLIKTKGERVSPKEIEEVLCEMEGISEAAVMGVPDEILGQAVKAFVCPRSSRSAGCPSEKQILAHCTEALESFMVPKYIEFRDSLPKLPSGKIDKKKLMEDALS